MNGLMMKYFVLKPAGDSPYSFASRSAMETYADAIGAENGKLADELRAWVKREEDARHARVIQCTKKLQHEGW